MDGHDRGSRSGPARQEVVHDLTAECAALRSPSQVVRAGDGLLHVFVPHATAGLAVLETGAGSDDDLLAALRDLLPADDRWRHRHGSPGHGRDHVLPALVPAVRHAPGPRRRLALGTWQSVCLVDLNGDNPGARSGCRSWRADGGSRWDRRFPVGTKRLRDGPERVDYARRDPTGRRRGRRQLEDSA